jgi:ABC-type polysaccharide/polyol phosphate transport system ATPase subunit
MPAPHAIVLDRVTKQYRSPSGRRLFLQVAMEWLRRRRPQVRTVLDDVSCTVAPGSTLGIIGPNGSGKSTLLRIISGVTSPTSGQVTAHGRLVSLLELGAGFDDRLTARDNIFLNGALIGIPRDVIARQTSSILEFAELAAFADTPLHTFSSGMIVRLGFAIAVHAEADVLLLDEVLAVGDVAFQAKCLKVIAQLRKNGTTIVFVSHDLYAVRNVSDEVLMLHQGRVEARGRPAEVIQRYWSTVLGEESVVALEQGPFKVVFQAGQLTLWWGDRVLTKGFCGYTSVRSFVRWHESDKAKWTVVSRTATCFEAEGRYWGLPAVQHWRVELDPQGVLTWEIAMTVEEELCFEREQANFMLGEEYDQLRADGYATELGDFKRAVGDDWEVVYAADAERGEVELVPRDATLPTVRFACTSPGTHEIRVVNSDANFRGRVVQALRKPGAETKPPGRYDYFRGTLAPKRSA